LVPQITGGVVPPDPVTLKVSVRHSVAVDDSTPAAVVTDPPVTMKFPVVTVLGPAMTNVLMSILI
jgi:hypothetical protein